MKSTTLNQDIPTPLDFTSIDGVLYNKDVTTLLRCPADKKTLVVPETVTAIGERAFFNCEHLADVILPVNLISIGKEAFTNCCILTKIFIPAMVKTIDDGAILAPWQKALPVQDEAANIRPLFWRCNSLESIDVDGRNTTFASVDGVLYNKEKTRLIRCPEARTNLTIPDSAQEIGHCSFGGCESLKSLTIPESVKVIAGKAFNECVSLSNISLPKSLIKIGHQAFRCCNALQSPTIPDSVSEIGFAAFKMCSSLVEITLPKTLKVIEEAVFEDCEALSSITLPARLEKISKRAFDGCDSLRSIISLAILPPEACRFGRFICDLATVRVPADSIDVYASTAPWCQFKEIKAI